MESLFIKYDQALSLKELGFNQRCLGQYSTHQGDKWIFSIDLSNEGQYPTTSPACIAPTFSQAFRWFRDKYDLYYTIEGSKKYGFAFFIYYENDDKGELKSKEYSTYEEAEQECLIKLIEITKQQK